MPRKQPTESTEVVPASPKTVKPRKHGRPPMINAERVKKITESRASGQTMKTSCLLGGIALATGNQWAARGRAELARVEEQGGDVAESEELYVDFAVAIERATEQATALLVDSIMTAGTVDGDWRAAAWMLSRRDPETWGEKTQVTQQSVTVGADGDVRLTELRKLIQSTTSNEEAA